MPFLEKLRRSPATLALIALQVVVFVAQAVNSGVADRLSLPGDLDGLSDRPWSPLTVMFVHENIAHIAVMVLMLSAFGTLLEQTARTRDVVAVYLLAGLAGSFTALAVVAAVETDGTLVGASAAVFGVAAAILAMRPSSKVFGGTTTQWFAALVGINVVFLLTQPLGSVAHLVGLAVGAAYGRWLLTRVGSRADERS
ncbi:rhomboid family intramembrane serine protease [Blastococcus sp. VKM Ac-2987]|uniref:rhomboid family intramembrane serine protease n=1 Tax=Blastococcus sp. VKM Ac-2987 TaxID=3004141 RepID=UPI0022AB6212|nr:rhomboid family intramembrane serine protease [Blastococcus sp. VKM Ac-2987]MCZ2860788.1 rhomboid family intramembrane serine protease [Blastococcus sp. VKM Ac-2987]